MLENSHSPLERDVASAAGCGDLDKRYMIEKNIQYKGIHNGGK